ncbi:MAG: phosphoribosyltransferase domain-containing protein [Clostridia bacterium]|nr:phosphoribosyltransferase domain-containing protein [Clostridia bacterium]
MDIQKDILSVRQNLTPFNIDEIIGIAKRDKNKKRSFLLVNKLQSKHYPSEPEKTDTLFSLLAKTVQIRFADKNNVLVIGFSETAVAIGAYIASVFKNSYYIQTTREIIQNKNFLTFDEVHSHAVTHRLYTDNLQEVIENCDLIVIADDEFTTGNTALNLINTLKSNFRIKQSCKICMTSIFNCVKDEDLIRINENNVEIISLVTAQFNSENLSFPYEFSQDNVLCKENKNIIFREISGKTVPYTAINTEKYIENCNKFIFEIMRILTPINPSENVLVVGTEEFSFCALKLGKMLKQTINNVSVQCTTQSPILPSDNKNYIINNRTRFESLYNSERTTYLYQLKNYDTAVILTDSENPSENSVKQLTNGIDAEKIFFIKWRN